ncbi:MAG: hypothetical protein KatS3mg113_0076 [Planctomycetaceae bacterium]|nr:MAG: hypothetical protein KatS3mg113_0076 [Planctomycetaceae bacterium]
MWHAPRPTRRLGRRGVSLLEVVLASSLLIVLLSGIYGALDQLRRLSEVNRLEIERQQVARAVFRRLEIDLRTAVLHRQPLATTLDDGSSSATNTASGSDSSSSAANSASTGSGSGSSGSSTSAGSATGSSESTVINAVESANTQLPTECLGIRGNSTELWIDRCAARPPWQLTNTASSDLLTVVYTLGEASLMNQTEDSGSNSVLILSDADGVGLLRSEGERILLNSSSDASGAPGPVGHVSSRN